MELAVSLSLLMRSSLSPGSRRASVSVRVTTVPPSGPDRVTVVSSRPSLVLTVILLSVEPSGRVTKVEVVLEPKLRKWKGGFLCVVVVLEDVPDPARRHRVQVRVRLVLPVPLLVDEAELVLEHEVPGPRRRLLLLVTFLVG